MEASVEPLDLVLLQEEHRVWRDHNFPVFRETDGLLGVVEEVGELSHAHLKMQQGIRGGEDKFRADAEDAIGDILIFLLSYCNTNGFNLATCVRRAWDEVKDRDWVKYPGTGVPNT